MSTHGEVRKDGVLIMAWAARRLDQLNSEDLEGPYDYEVSAFYPDQTGAHDTLSPGVPIRVLERRAGRGFARGGPQAGDTYTGVVTHVRSDGAMALVNTVLGWASAQREAAANEPASQ